jgi:pimeloyl-ACP methyl ester carboxylesterase
VSPSGVFGDEAEKAEWEKVFKSSISEGFSAIRPRMFEKEPLWFRLVAHQFAEFTRREDVAAFMTSFGEEHRLDARLDKVHAKTWLIWGNRDRLVPWGWHLAWLKGLRADPCNPRAILLKGVGHSPQFEVPGRVALVLAQVLQGRLPHRLGARWWVAVEPESSAGGSSASCSPGAEA